MQKTFINGLNLFARSVCIVKESKTQLLNVQFHLAHHCNLNCKYCSATCFDTLYLPSKSELKKGE